jgi:hypothetical protein
VEDDLSKAPAADDDCSAIICLYPVVPKTDWSCSPIGIQL